MCGVENWTFGEVDQRHLKVSKCGAAGEGWRNIIWTDRVSGEELLQRVREERNMEKINRKREG